MSPVKSSKTHRKTGAGRGSATGRKVARKKTPAAKKKTPAAKKKTTRATKKTPATKKKTARTVKKKTPAARKVPGKPTVAQKTTNKKTVARKAATWSSGTTSGAGEMRTRTEPQVPTPRPRAESYKEALKVYADAMALIQKKEWKPAAGILADFVSRHARERELCQRARTYLRVCGAHMNVMDETPDTVEGFLLLATVRSNDGDLKTALTLLNQALKSFPDDYKLLYLQASTLALTGDHRASLKALARSITADEQNRIYATNSPDFADLRDDEEFITLTTREDEEY